MAFNLGNFSIDEILYAVAEDFDGQLLYALDQLSSASIEISSESTDITDKKGNVVRTIYKNKTGTLSATNAFLHPQIMNAASGSDIEYASSTSKIVMPKIEVINATSTAASLALTDADDDSVKVIGIYGNGATVTLTKSSTSTTTPSAGVWSYDTTTDKVYVPAAGEGLPVQYLVKYDRTIASGMKLTNSAKEFPATVKMTLYCSYVDPCDDTLRAAYVVLPSFQASPETTVQLNADEQEMDFTGNLQISYCEADQPLYYIYLPDEDAVKTGI